MVETRLPRYGHWFLYGPVRGLVGIDCIIPSFICLHCGLTIAWVESTHQRFMVAMYPQDPTQACTVEIYCWMKRQVKKGCFMDIYCSETKGNLHLDFDTINGDSLGWTSVDHCHFCLNLPSGILAHAKEKLEIKSLSFHTFIECLFTVCDDTANNIASCVCWYMLFILIIKIQKYYSEKKILL